MLYRRGERLRAGTYGTVAGLDGVSRLARIEAGRGHDSYYAALESMPAGVARGMRVKFDGTQWVEAGYRPAQGKGG
jgi:hypothetical protein